MDMAKCLRCKEEKVIEEFGIYRNRRNKTCKKCLDFLRNYELNERKIKKEEDVDSTLYDIYQKSPEWFDVCCKKMRSKLCNERKCRWCFLKSEASREFSRDIPNPRNTWHNPRKCTSNKKIGKEIYICDHYNLLILFPELCLEWDYEKNTTRPENYSHTSIEKVYWVCSENPCGCHKWITMINSRIVRKDGCPLCRYNRKPCPHYNFKLFHPDKALEWDYEKNKGRPEDFSPRCKEVKWWICSKSQCGCHVWRASMSTRTGGCGCPFCSINKVCKHNNFKVTHPEEALEWNYEKNKDNPEDYSYGSTKIIHWKCHKSHEWTTAINDRTNSSRATGCPSCVNASHSKRQIEWMEDIMKKEDVFIKHFCNGGEYKIEGVGKVDGYCEKNNTVYEFHGTYWHGHPSACDFLGYHPVSKKRNIEIYMKTLLRDRKIRDLGYNLVTIWENKFLENMLHI